MYSNGILKTGILASKNGTPGATRTRDTRFRKPLLYPLSYRGTPSKLIIAKDKGKGQRLGGKTAKFRAVGGSSRGGQSLSRLPPGFSYCG